MLTTLEENELKMKNFSKDKLQKYNGEHGNPFYIAYKDKVYDLSGSNKK